MVRYLHEKQQIAVLVVEPCMDTAKDLYKQSRHPEWYEA